MKYENWISQNGITYRQILLKDSKIKIIFTDRAFENFDLLVNALPIEEKNKEAIDCHQAKNNISNVNFNILLFSGFLILFVFNGFRNYSFPLVIILFFNGLLLLASIKRKLKYDKIIKWANSKGIE